jgi:hypothetical protein
MITALSLLPVGILVGFTLDNGRIASARQDLQASVDAAVLNAAVTYFSASGAGQEAAENAARLRGESHFASQIAQSRRFSKQDAVAITFPQAGLIVGTATGKVDLVFGGMIGRDAFDLTVTAEATAGGGKRVEIALLLDNSSSMFESNRMQLMRGAARSFSHRMFDTLGENNVKVSVVPWAATVNIMAEPVAAADDAAYTAAVPGVPAGSRLEPNAPGGAPWSHTLNPFTGSAISTRSQADALFAPTEWRGCIRAAAGERQVDASGTVTAALTDAFPGSDWPLGLVPPDLSPMFTVASGACGTAGATGAAGPSPSGTQASIMPDFSPWWRQDSPEPEPVRDPGTCWYVSGYDLTRLDKGQWHDFGSRNAYFPKDVTVWSYSDYALPQVSETVAACLGDPNEFAYWNDGKPDCWHMPNLSSGAPDPILPWDKHKAISGPNLNCPSAILPPSSNRRQVIRKIDHLYPVPGGTQVDVGLMWGLRTLSPRTEWASFWGLSGAQVPGAFGDPNVLKYAILLTDGINDAPIDFEGYYGCTKNWRATGYDVGSVEDFDESATCWQSPDIQSLNKASLDALMIDACTEMKNTYGIRLFTIAVDINDPTSINLLKQCASSEDDFFNISSAQMDITFNSILTSVVRLSR